MLPAWIYTPPHTPGESQEKPGPLSSLPWLWWLLLALIFAVGLAVRLYDLSDPPLDFHPTRQLHSALIARGMYYQDLASAPQWQRELAVRQWHAEGLIEPQVFERVVAFTYRLAGSADLTIPRLYSIFFWMVGAVFLVLLAAEMVGREGALAAALFFLAWPYTVTASRAFQPDPLMVTLIIAALWALLRWQRRATWGWALAAGVLAGLSIYIKSVAVFFVAPAFLAVLGTQLAASRQVRLLRSPQVWALGGLMILPYAIYHIDGVYLRGFLVDQFSLRFFPSMWIDPAFYLRWISNLGRAIPFELALVALLGALLPRRPGDRAVLLSLWVGYFAYGMALPHHISTHDYYHLPLFPVAALGLAAVAALIYRSLRGPLWFTRLAGASILLAALVLIGYQARSDLKRTDNRAEAQMWQEVGQALTPGASVVILSPDYGTGLSYWGWVVPTDWPTADDINWRVSIGQPFDYTAQFAEFTAGKDYFLVSPLDELQQQPDLAAYLPDHARLIQQSDRYQLYDLRP